MLLYVTYDAYLSEYHVGWLILLSFQVRDQRMASQELAWDYIYMMSQ